MERFSVELDHLKKDKKNVNIIKIGDYLLEIANQDKKIAENLNKENKSLKNCWAYINQEARKNAVNGCAMIEDSKVYGWAIHYYDEDDLKIDKEKPSMDVSKNEHPRAAKTPVQTPVVIKEKLPKQTKKKINENQGSLF